MHRDSDTQYKVRFPCDLLGSFASFSTFILDLPIVILQKEYSAADSSEAIIY